MKLINLQGSSGDFQNIFNNDILVEEKSKIGLLNLSLLFKGIKIDDNNNAFRFQTKEENDEIVVPFMSVELTTGTYLPQDFLVHLMQQMSSALGYMANGITLSEIGFQWRLKLSFEKRLTIMWRRSERLYPEHGSQFIEELPGNQIQRTAEATTGVWDAFLVSTRFVCNGICSNFVRVDADATEFAWGLTVKTSNSLDTLEPTDFTFCLYCDSLGKYHTIAKGVDVDTDVDCITGDTLEINIVGGNLVFKVNDVIEGSFPYTFSNHYHLGVSILTDGASLNELLFVADPFMVVGTTNQELIYTEEPVHSIKIDAERGVTIIDFSTLEKPNTSQLLGFSSLILTSQLLTNSFFEAEFSINNLQPNSIIIEIPNITIESYDGYVSRKRPIIAYIPSLDIKDFAFNYSPPSPLMIDLNNSENFNLKQIHIRVLPIDGTTPVDLDKCSISIVVGK